MRPALGYREGQVRREEGKREGEKEEERERGLFTVGFGLLVYKKGTSYAAQTGLELVMPLPLPSKERLRNACFTSASLPQLSALQLSSYSLRGA